VTLQLQGAVAAEAVGGKGLDNVFQGAWIGALRIDIINAHEPSAASLFDVAETGQSSHKTAHM
jgi:hypothetical protein